MSECVVCGGTAWRRLFVRLGAGYVRCRECGLIRMEIMPTADEIARHYAEKFRTGNYEVIRKYAVAYDSIYRDFLDFTLRHAGAPRGRHLLDIGCFTGRFLDLADEAGFVTHGVEYQADAARIANEHHEGRVYCGAIEGYAPPSSVGFDVVTAFGVIEHVTAPDVTVRVAARWMKPGGILVIETPNTASLPARLLGRLWPPYAPVEHIHYFSPDNLGRLLARTGFRLIARARHWKWLPLGYVYDQFRNFGPEYHRILSALMPLVPTAMLARPLPFYGGEMLLVAQRL